MKIKGFLVLISLLFAFPVFATEYTLRIDGKNYPLILGEEQMIRLPDGEEVLVRVDQKEILEFRQEKYSFSHPKELRPRRKNVGGGDWETTMTTPSGTMLVIHESEKDDNAEIAELFLKDLEEEEEMAGYMRKTTKALQTLADGRQLHGHHILSTGDDGTILRHLYRFPRKNSSLLIFTEMKEENGETDQKVLDLFWNTLNLKMK